MDLDLLSDTYARVTGLVDDADASVLARPTRTEAWSVAELLFHLLLDVQRALVALGTPSERPPDVDRVTYWRPFRPSEGDGGASHAAFVRRSTAAYRTPLTVVEQWRETSAAVPHAASRCDPAETVLTQGHALTVSDLVSTLVVEATVHLLDLTLHLPGGPSASALAHTRGVLEALLGSPLPAAWDDRAAVLRGAGREQPDEEGRAVLGSAAARLPLLG